MIAMDGSSPEALVDQLVHDLQPVRRLAPPARRALLWLGVVGLVACGLASVVDLHVFASRIFGAPDMTLALAGSILTCITAAFAGFQLSLPDRRADWLLLPLPFLALWLGASGMGCLRSLLVPTMHLGTMRESLECLRYIISVSVPLSILLLWMLRRAKPLRPNLVAVMAGLAAAAAAASLLWFTHPLDASVTDLTAHFIAVALVVGLNRLMGGRLLNAG